MKFTLKDYQDEAVRDVLANLRKARKRWHEDGDKHAFSLTATTGAGKTVMAAAVFEALFHGDDDYDFDADPGAVVIWFSDDPSLNEQTRFRLMEASDRLAAHRSGGGGEHLQPRASSRPGRSTSSTPRSWARRACWCAATIERLTHELESVPGNPPRPALAHDLGHDPQHHRRPGADALPRARRGAPGHGQPEQSSTERRSPPSSSGSSTARSGVPGIPVVWGISATVERFNKAMDGAQERSTLPNVVVDAAKVQESGLLKDTIILDIPDEAGDFDTVLVRRATDKLKESTEAWAEYAEQQDDARDRPAADGAAGARTRPTPTTSAVRWTRSSSSGRSCRRQRGARVRRAHHPDVRQPLPCPTSRRSACRTQPGCAC